MSLYIEWMNDPENKRLLHRETMLLEITESIVAHIEKHKITQAILAKKMGKSKQHISKILQGDHNMELSTLADMLWALGVDIEIQIQPTSNHEK